MLARLTLVLCLCAGAAFAGDLEEDVRADLSSRGYQDIEFSKSSGVLSVTCWRDGRQLTVVYNAGTGEVLSQSLAPMAESES